jgi:hypothetical protein
MINRVMKAAAHMIRASAPPKRQGVGEQPSL